jgi:hypothetical protein
VFLSSCCGFLRVRVYSWQRGPVFCVVAVMAGTRGDLCWEERLAVLSIGLVRLCAVTVELACEKETLSFGAQTCGD